MSQDCTPPPARQPHPAWCDPGECTVNHLHPYGAHQSASRVVPAEPPSGTAIEAHLTSLFRGVVPNPLLVAEFIDSDPDGTPVPYLLTLPQARLLHDALGHLIAIATLPSDIPAAA